MPYRTRWVGTITNRATLVALAFGVVVGASPAQGATFSWSPANTSILLETKALRQTVSGVTARAQGYTVEYTASTAEVFGPYPTGSGANGLKIFGVDVRRLGQQAAEDLGLISQKLSGIAVGGCDCGAGGTSPGFDNKPYRTGDTTITKLDVALFEFSQAIKVNTVKVDQVSNFGRQIWVAACSAAPNFGNGLKAAISACAVKNGNDTPGGATFTHGFVIFLSALGPTRRDRTPTLLVASPPATRTRISSSRQSTSPSDAGSPPEHRRASALLTT